MEKFTELKELIASLETEFAKVAAGNKAARTRTRVGLQKVKVLAQDLRVAIGSME